jgi:hypothetical protein
MKTAPEVRLVIASSMSASIRAVYVLCTLLLLILPAVVQAQFTFTTNNEKVSVNDNVI